MSATESSPKVLGYECKFAVYCPPPQGESTDVHVVKEVVHMDNGEKVPQIRLVRNFPMSFYVTKKGHRNHEQKKEFEDLDKLDKFMTTQSQAPFAIAKALGTPWVKGDVRRLARSPYLYGTDVLSTSRIKKTYQDKYPDLVSAYSVAVFDTETDVVHGTEEVIMATISFGKRVYTAVVASFVEGTAAVEARAHEALVKYLGSFEKIEDDGSVTIRNILEERKIEWEFEVVPSPIECIKRCINKAHDWKPDILAMWNINFDIPKLLETCEKAGVNPADLLSDPSVPKQYRHCNYKQGPRKKVTASNKEMPIKPADQWHTLYVPASFYVLDGMCVYRKRRVAKGELPSYSLDYILDKELGVRKLKFKQAEGFYKIDWHYEMQTKWKIEYIIYNVFDCISVEQLDEVTTDLHLGMPLACEMSDFANFKSQPRRVVDSLHYFGLERGKVIGSTSDDMTDGFENKTVSPKDWINLLSLWRVIARRKDI